MCLNSPWESIVLSMLPCHLPNGFPTSRVSWWAMVWLTGNLIAIPPTSTWHTSTEWSAMSCGKTSLWTTAHLLMLTHPNLTLWVLYAQVFIISSKIKYHSSIATISLAHAGGATRATCAWVLSAMHKSTNSWVKNSTHLSLANTRTILGQETWENFLPVLGADPS